jgi:hypothetical protein
MTPTLYSDLKGIRVEAKREVAHSSPDHNVPWGTRRDNSRNWRFNQKLNKLYEGKKGPLAVLDLGCSGGGFVKDCLDDGGLAVGLEGSDFSKKRRRAEWRTIPEYLFTADITAPFQVYGEFEKGASPLKFDVVTSWEVIEHISEADLKQVSENVAGHLGPGGIWIMSVSPNIEIIDGIHLHQTVQPQEWWLQKFRALGWVNLDSYLNFFNTQFVRGPKYGAPGSFHLILTRDVTQIPAVPHERLVVRIYDKWLGSPVQRLLKLFVAGV